MLHNQFFPPWHLLYVLASRGVLLDIPWLIPDTSSRICCMKVAVLRLSSTNKWYFQQDKQHGNSPHTPLNAVPPCSPSSEPLHPPCDSIKLVNKKCSGRKQHLLLAKKSITQRQYRQVSFLGWLLFSGLVSRLASVTVLVTCTKGGVDAFNWVNWDLAASSPKICLICLLLLIKFATNSARSSLPFTWSTYGWCTCSW